MRIQFWSAIVLVGALSACAGAPKTAEEKKSLSATVATSIDLVKKVDPTIEKFFKDNYAYAVLPSVGKGGFIIGGAGGDGEVYKGGKLVGYCSMGQGTIGATIGGQSFDEFIFFKDEANYKVFTANKFAFTAQVSAVMVASGTGAATSYHDGVAIFVSNVEGAMAEAAVGGQQFKFVSLDAVAAPKAK
jgi:lipid-binding SYLF domain-containing protein